MSADDSVFTHRENLWRWEALCRSLNLPVVAGPEVTRVITDSRMAEPGDLFVALPGDPGARFHPSHRSNADGHDYVDDAMAAGAVGALVSSPVQSTPVLAVQDSYDGLWQLGHAAAERHTGWRVAITGSSGKTTAKSFLRAATGAYASPGSFNNHIGVPLSLANCAATEPGAIFEIGTNHPGEIAPLAEMVQPSVALLLNVHQAHRENFPDQAALRDEKISIFSSLRDKSKAVCDEEVALGFGRTFGESRQADARIISLQGDRLRCSVLGREVDVKVPGGGVHRARTLLAVLLVLDCLELDIEDAFDLGERVVPNGRGAVHRVAGYTVVDDSYNANPQSMMAALVSFTTRFPQDRVLVVGTMAELTDEIAAAAYAQLESFLQAHTGASTRVVLVGEDLKETARRLDAAWFPQADATCLAGVIDRVRTLSPEAAVFVKGSNGVFWQAGFVNKLISEMK